MQIALAVIVALLSGCAMQSQVPIPEKHALTYQKELRASHHWNLLAADAAEQIRASVAIAGIKAVYVPDPAERTDFNRAFQSLLVTQLVDKGLRVATTSANAVSVGFDTQVVAHRSDRIAYRPGTLTALGLGILVLRGVALNGNPLERGATFLGLAGAADAAMTVYGGPTPKTEIIVTTSINDGSRFVTRRTDIYYIQESDTALFLPKTEAAAPRLKDLRVTGDTK